MRYEQSQLVTFSENHFAAIFGGHLGFLRKTQKTLFFLDTVRDRAISIKFLTHRVLAEHTGDFLTICFPATFGSHLEFLCKAQKHTYLRNGAK